MFISSLSKKEKPTKGENVEHLPGVTITISREGRDPEQENSRDGDHHWWASHFPQLLCQGGNLALTGLGNGAMGKSQPASWNPSPSSERTQHPKYRIPQWMKRYSIMCRCRHSQRLELAFAATSWFAQLPRMVSWLFTTIITDTHINFPFRQLHVWDGLNQPVYPVLSYCGLKILWVENTVSWKYCGLLILAAS